MDSTTRVLMLDPATAPQILGEADRTLRTLENATGVMIHVRGERMTLTGDEDDILIVETVVRDVESMAARGNPISPETVTRVLALVRNNARGAVDEPIVTYRGKSVLPTTSGQRDYVRAIDRRNVIFGVGPAGSGKTYLAVAKAVHALQTKQVRRIILTRPAVEAGENLGFLPGTLNDKIDPYLRPLYDSLRDMMDPEMIPRLVESGVIEVAPLAYMRGRTLNDAFVILDEAQNTTPSQMKMFLTRLGFGTTMVITGDLSQVDLPVRQESGLARAIAVVEGLEGTAVVRLSSQDVVRHGLVSAIVDAYDAYEEEQRIRADMVLPRKAASAAARKGL